MQFVTLLVYDFDGTLVDTKEDIALSVNLTLKELRLPQKDSNEIFGYIGNGVGQLLERALSGSGYFDVENAVKKFREIYDSHLIDKTRYYPGCQKIIEHFSYKKQAICSNKPEYFIKRILKEFDSETWFDPIVGGDTTPVKKPDPKILLGIIEKHQSLPNETVLIGDSGVDIETGKRAGVLTCGVTYGIGGKDAVKDADFVIDHISELKELFH
jgi:phosphoglycolate phosphatase